MLTGTRMRCRTIARTLTASVVALALAASVGCGGEPETNIKPADDKPDKSDQQKQQAKDTPTPTHRIEDEPHVQVALGYYEAMNKAIRTGDAERLRELSAESCEACHGAADQVEQIYKDGGHIEGGETSPVPGDDMHYTIDGNMAYVTIVYKYEPQVIVSEKGAEPEEYGVQYRKKDFTLEREGGNWEIIKLLSSKQEKP